MVAKGGQSEILAGVAIEPIALHTPNNLWEVVGVFCGYKPMT